MRRIVLCSGIGFVLALAPLTASADIIRPDLESCNEAGESCTTAGRKPGRCAKQRCSRVMPDGRMEYDCLICVPTKANATKKNPKK